MKVVSKNLKETEDFVKKILEILSKSKNDKATVLCLYGNLGAGKTAFTQLLGKTLGVKEVMQSPTYLILKNYKLPSLKTYKLLIHIDAYRIEHYKEMIALDFEKLLEDKDNLLVIEWPEKIKELLPKETHNIYFEFVDENTRNIEY